MHHHIIIVSLILLILDNVICLTKRWNKMSTFGEVLSQLAPETRSIVRRIEQNDKKITNAHYAIVFDKKCINEGLLPNFTNIRLHDPAVRKRQFTLDFRRKLIDEQVKLKEKKLLDLANICSDLERQYENSQVTAELRSRIDYFLKANRTYYDGVVRQRILKKLNRLYGGRVLLPNPSDCYINLSSVELTDAQKQYLNLGVNFHVQSKYLPYEKNVELELLYQSVIKLRDAGKVSVNENLRPLLLAESTKDRQGKNTNSVLTPELRQAARELRENREIIVRKADKASVYVIMDRAEYLSKMNDILSDATKFKKISRDTTEALKRKVNQLIVSANAAVGQEHFAKLVGEYAPGYMYGTVKTHKPHNPLRPIISQISTPTYSMAKSLNTLLTPYVPATHTLESSQDFVELLKSKTSGGILASLDAESLFTNVPVSETIQILLAQAYDNPQLAPPKLSRSLCEKMLRVCTTEAPFRSPDGSLYLQTDGVAMGSPLGVLFANAYMAKVEDDVISSLDPPPHIYRRYVDDMFVEVGDENDLEQLRLKFEDRSLLHFTKEVGIGNKLPFLDVEVKIADGQHQLSVHRKLTNQGKCLDARSECPERYKTGVIRSYVRRALLTCSTWQLVHQELQKLKQTLVNNHYSCQEIDKEVREALHKFLTKPKEGRQTEGEKGQTYRIFYKNQMTANYKADEKALKQIIKKNVTPQDKKDRLQVVIYYRNKRASNLVMKNNEHDSGKLKATNVIYAFKCTYGDCEPRPDAEYIGHTTTSLSRRLTCHLQSGSPLQHMKDAHNRKLTRADLTENTTILARESNRKRLQITEAVFIRLRKPLINTQQEHDGILTLWNLF